VEEEFSGREGRIHTAIKGMEEEKRVKGRERVRMKGRERAGVKGRE
jgi:hypothetical protein